MKRTVQIATGTLAVVISLAAYYLGAAPFAPAVLLSAISGSLALISLIIKVWRLALLALYFSIFSVLTSPSFGVAPFTSDEMFFGVALVGVALSLGLWVSWRRSFSRT